MIPVHRAEDGAGSTDRAGRARHAGVAGIRIVPIGLHHENRAGFRSRALMNAGLPRLAHRPHLDAAAEVLLNDVDPTPPGGMQYGTRRASPAG